MSAVNPKVKRGYAAGFSNPTVATSSPSSSETKLLSGRPGETNAAHVSPSTTSHRYSNELNSRATFASAGAALIKTRVPRSPPIAENTRLAPSAVSASPRRVIAYASSQ